MSGAFFYIEYNDGRITEIEFKTSKMAKQAYMLYDREPENNAKCWGWDTKYEAPTLAQKIRANKMTKELA